MIENRKIVSLTPVHADAGQGMAVTPLTSSSVHASGAVAYELGVPVNEHFAKKVLEILPRCKK